MSAGEGGDAASGLGQLPFSSGLAPPGQEEDAAAWTEKDDDGPRRAAVARTAASRDEGLVNLILYRLITHPLTY